MPLRPRFTYANVMSTLAVSIALAGGGAAVAAGVAANSVGSLQIRNGSIVGVDVAEARLGKVPRATRADRADRAGSAGRADTATRAANVLRATVRGDGSLVSSSGRVTSAKLSAGYYELTFPRDVLRCTSVATLGYTELGARGTFGFAATGHGLTNRVISVATALSDGRSWDLSFELFVAC